MGTGYLRIRSRLMLIPMSTVIDLWNPHYPPRIIHVGAHLGEERDAYEAAGTAVVWWCEGNPDLLPPLRSHLCEPRPQTSTQHQVVHAILGPRDDEPIILNIAEDTMTSSVLAGGTVPVDYVGAHSMRSTTLDTICGELGQPTMIACDAQGFDLEILRGAQKTLPGVEVVYVEVSEVPIYKGSAHRTEVDQFLWDAGFRLALTEMSRNGEGWGDSCYVRRGIR